MFYFAVNMIQDNIMKEFEGGYGEFTGTILAKEDKKVLIIDMQTKDGRSVCKEMWLHDSNNRFGRIKIRSSVRFSAEVYKKEDAYLLKNPFMVRFVDSLDTSFPYKENKIVKVPISLDTLNIRYGSMTKISKRQLKQIVKDLQFKIRELRKIKNNTPWRYDDCKIGWTKEIGYTSLEELADLIQFEESDERDSTQGYVRHTDEVACPFCTATTEYIDNFNDGFFGCMKCGKDFFLMTLEQKDGKN